MPLMVDTPSKALQEFHCQRVVIPSMVSVDSLLLTDVFFGACPLTFLYFTEAEDALLDPGDISFGSTDKPSSGTAACIID